MIEFRESTLVSHGILGMGLSRFMKFDGDLGRLLSYTDSDINSNVLICTGKLSLYVRVREVVNN